MEPTAILPRKALRTVVINFQSIKNKVPETQALTDNAEPDVIIGTETWLNSNISSSEVLPSSYNVFRKDRSDGAYYRPPNTTSDEHAKQVTEDLAKLRMEHQKCNFWIGGDFNLPDIDWPSQTVNSYQYPASMSNLFLNIPTQCGVVQVVESPTRGSKILDLFFTNNPFLVEKCKLTPGVGDHDAILVDTLFRPRRVKPTKRKIYLWDKADTSDLKDETARYARTFITESFPSIDSMWSSLRDNILRLLNIHVPHKLTRSKHTDPWINTETRRLTRRKLRAFQKAKTTGNRRDIQRYNRLKSTCQKSIRQAHDNYMRNIISPEAKQNPKKFWSFIKGKKQESSGVSRLRSSDGLIHSESNTKANILNAQFQSAYTKEDLTTMPNKGPSPYDPMAPII
ncbi:uncharacterized protein LOC128549116 [Mercenaria mercenaria]|uniref:uncharacterized protein LOC128549116 n=1 Tax=Mercenaria mercenaria TaxID=6596 RepID=UPI00234F6A59|nr:uncharacterized protein LOC128549116 [Mercenaria mercenaria]